MPKTAEQPTRARKSINELTGTIERSGEKVRPVPGTRWKHAHSNCKAIALG